MSLLELEIDAWYGAAPALSNVALKLNRGEVLGLIGASGSGKSTLTLALLGLLGHQGGRVSGRIVFDGRDLMSLTSREWRTVRGRQIALVPQNAHGALNPALRLRSHFEEAWRAHSAEPWRTQEPAVLERLAELELPGERAFLDRYPGQISTGQAQRVLIALALLHRPALVIADEPTSALDPLAASEALGLFRRINTNHQVALLYISHDLASVAGLCHRVAILHAGRVVETGTTGQIFADPREGYTQRLVAAIPRLPEWRPAPSLGNLAAATSRPAVVPAPVPSSTPAK